MFERADKIMEQSAAERAVCLMDIPDDWNQEYNLELYMETFDAAIAFAKKYPETLWVYGNHDLCYLWDERESGYSPAAAYTVVKKLEELKSALPEGNVISCDVFSTYRDGRAIGTEEFAVVETERWEYEGEVKNE